MNENNISGSANLTYEGYGAAGINGATTTTTGAFFVNSYKKELYDTKIINDTEGMFIEIIYKMIPNQNYSYGYGLTDNRTKIKKEVYGVLNGSLQLIKEIDGFENPGYYVDPEIEWQE